MKCECCWKLRKRVICQIVFNAVQNFSLLHMSFSLTAQVSATDLITVSGDYVDYETSRVGAGHKVENDSEHTESGEEGTDITKRVHEGKPHIVNAETRQPAGRGVEGMEFCFVHKLNITCKESTNTKLC